MAEQGRKSKFFCQAIGSRRKQKAHKHKKEISNEWMNELTVIGVVGTALGNQCPSSWEFQRWMTSPSYPMWLCYSRRQTDQKCPATFLDSKVYIQSFIKTVLRFHSVKFTWDLWEFNPAAKVIKAKLEFTFNPTVDWSITNSFIDFFIQ